MSKNHKSEAASPESSGSCFRQRVLRWDWEISGVPVSGCKIRWRNFSADLHFTGFGPWATTHDRSRDIHRTHDKKPGRSYHTFGKSAGFPFGGWINAIILILIVPYYSVIGGWVIRYLFGYLTGHGAQLCGGRKFFRLHFQRSSNRDLLYRLCVFLPCLSFTRVCETALSVYPNS